MRGLNSARLLSNSGLVSKIFASVKKLGYSEELISRDY
jgi:hypothetical protein